MQVLRRNSSPRYQRDRITSYLLVSALTSRAEHLAITLVEMEPGGVQHLHAHAPEQMYYILEGSGVMTVDAERQPVQAGDCIFFASGATHGLENTGATVLRYLSAASPSFTRDECRELWPLASLDMAAASAERRASRMPVPQLDARRDDEPPPAIAKLGWRYHHLGVPTDQPRPGEKYIAPYKMYVSGFSSSPYGVEWMRFEPGCPLPHLIQTVPHVAFEVDDLDAALEGQEVIFPPGSPSEGVRAAMIIHQGAPVELIAFRRTT